MKSPPAYAFEQSIKEVIAHLHNDEHPTAVALRKEAYELAVLFREQYGMLYIEARHISRLFSLYRRVMSYLIDKRHKFWQSLYRPEAHKRRVS